jgi:alpha-ribazole phosphatase
MAAAPDAPDTGAAAGHAGRIGSGRCCDDAAPGAGLWLWRHPRPSGAAGRCIGRTDLPVHARRAKRLAHRIRQAARRHALPAVVWTSPLQRCAAVGRMLARWGWVHHTDERLLELDFGAWDGQCWADIPWGQVRAWEADFCAHRPGGGEALASLAARVQAWRAEAAAGPAAARLVVAHAGVVNLLALGPAWPGLTAARWPRPPGYGALTRLPA